MVPWQLQRVYRSGPAMIQSAGSAAELATSAVGVQLQSAGSAAELAISAVCVQLQSAGSAAGSADIAISTGHGRA